MALRKIRLNPDVLLRKKSRLVEKFDEKLKILVDDMIETMYKEEGVGLAAPQIGILRRVIVIDIYDDTGVKVIVNPEIINQEGSYLDTEGCLSVPGAIGYVDRPEKTVVKGFDVKGAEITVEGVGLLSRALCHEIDHLNGVLFIDKIVEVEDEVEIEEEE